MPEAEESGNPWWLIPLIIVITMVIIMFIITSKSKYETMRQNEELQHLLQKTTAQEGLIREANSKTAELQKMHEQLKNSIATSQQQAAPIPAITTLQETLSDIKNNIVEKSDERELAKTLKPG
ncbi:MAG: hypothetical protein MZU97_09225 [Bacillus subtilis]|nr:hypothetical protein [Bacillus subtilis]